MKTIYIFKGQLTDEQKAILKETYKDTPLFFLASKDNKGQEHHIVFRPIFHALYERIQNVVDESRARGGVVPKRDLDELIFEECLVWPEISEKEREELHVSVLSNFSKLVEEKSGFTEVSVDGQWIGPNTQVRPLKDFEYWPDYTMDELKAIKEKTPFPLFRVRMDRWIFIIRPLTTQDVRVAQTQVDSGLTLARATVMWPEHDKIDWSIIPAGIVDAVANQATKVSGWDTGENVEIQEL